MIRYYVWPLRVLSCKKFTYHPSCYGGGISLCWPPVHQDNTNTCLVTMTQTCLIGLWFKMKTKPKKWIGCRLVGTRSHIANVISKLFSFSRFHQNFRWAQHWCISCFATPALLTPLWFNDSILSMYTGLYLIIESSSRSHPQQNKQKMTQLVEELARGI